MTSDTKFGLLLGLIFIFVIAFVINGLPGFRQNRNTNELTYNMVGLQAEPETLAARERIAQRRYVEPPYVAPPAPVEAHAVSQNPSRPIWSFFRGENRPGSDAFGS